MNRFDLVIANGRVVDGSGARPRVADVAITLSLPEAVHILTRRPAELFSLFDRGLIAQGHLAGINVIDFDRLRLRGRRLHPRLTSLGA